jgi:hypothetical protein
VGDWQPSSVSDHGTLNHSTLLHRSRRIVDGSAEEKDGLTGDVEKLKLQKAHPLPPALVSVFLEDPFALKRFQRGGGADGLDSWLRNRYGD